MDAGHTEGGRDQGAPPTPEDMRPEAPDMRAEAPAEEMGPAPDQRPPARDMAPEFEFEGRWIVHDNVPRGGITADIYQFHEDGRLELLRQYDPAGVIRYCPEFDPEDPQSCPLWAEEDDAPPSCKFSASWSSPAPGWLVLGSSCTDGLEREIELRFEDFPTSYELPGAPAELMRVGDNEQGWIYLNFAGERGSPYFARCDPRVDFCPTP